MTAVNNQAPPQPIYYGPPGALNQPGSAPPPGYVQPAGGYPPPYAGQYPQQYGQPYPPMYPQQHPIAQQYPPQPVPPGYPNYNQGGATPFAPMNDPTSTDYPAGQPNEWGIPSDKLITEDLDVSIRHAFVRKVYGILTVQLLITFGLSMMFALVDTAADWLIHNPWLMIVSMVLALVLVMVLTCVPSVARSHPWNLILLFIISLAFGVMLGYASAAVSTQAFFMAAGITCGVAFALSLFACQTKYDFTGCGVFVFVTIIVLMIFGFICIFVRNRIVHLVYASLGALLFSFYMVFDTQRVVGGKHRKFQFSIDDYIFAALTLYMDIINLFTYILAIISTAER